MNQSYVNTLELLKRASDQMNEVGDMLLVAMIGDVMDVMADRIDRAEGQSH